MNARDTAAILAGLRLLQSQMFMLGGPGTVGDIATDGGTLPMPTAEYIDDLVAILNRDVEINVTPPTAPDDDGAGEIAIIARHKYSENPEIVIEEAEPRARQEQGGCWVAAWVWVETAYGHTSRATRSFRVF